MRSEKVTYQTGAEHRLIWGIDPKADARTTPVLIEEIDARLLEGSLNDVEGCFSRWAHLSRHSSW